MNRRTSYTLIALSMLLTACIGRGKLLQKRDFEDWPLKVESCHVKCLGDYAVVIEVDDVIYAVNDAAREIGKYADAREITRSDPNYPGEQVKMKLSEIEFEGLKLCE